MLANHGRHIVAVVPAASMPFNAVNAFNALGPRQSSIPLRRRLLDANLESIFFSRQTMTPDSSLGIITQDGLFLSGEGYSSLSSCS